MKELIMLQGPPGSGKTTYALAECAKNPMLVRVNKDDIRELLFGTKKGQHRDHAEVRRSEKGQVLPEQERQIDEALDRGLSVIIDDVNVGGGHEARLRGIASAFGAQFRIVPFKTSLQDCLDRNAVRPIEERVPESAIRMFHNEMTKLYPPTFAKYEHQIDLPWTFIVDLDGTAAVMGKRSPYDASRCDELDACNTAVWHVVRSMTKDTMRPIYLSGREDKDRDATQRFLEKWNYPAGQLLMRKTGDTRKDWIIKGEIFDQHVRGKFNVLLCLDDRDQVVEFWRGLGLTCFQVAPGDF